MNYARKSGYRGQAPANRMRVTIVAGLGGVRESPESIAMFGGANEGKSEEFPCERGGGENVCSYGAIPHGQTHQSQAHPLLYAQL